MAVKIPAMPKPKYAKPLQACIDHAAEETGYDPYTVALIVSHFLDGVTDQVRRGEVVRIMGFGMFGAATRKSVPTHGVNDGRCYPAFHAARSFRVVVQDECAPSESRAKTMQNFRVNAHPCKPHGSDQPDPRYAMKQFRQCIRKSAEAHGVLLPPARQSA